MDKKGDKDNGMLEIYAHLYSGTQLALTVLIFFYIGYWADRKLNTKPWLTIIGSAVGFAVGMYNFIKSYGRKGSG